MKLTEYRGAVATVLFFNVTVIICKRIVEIVQKNL